MTRVVELTEYGSVRARLNGAEQRDLIEAAGTRLNFGATAEPGRVDITATSHVGTIVTDSVQILVRPKVSIDNVFYLLEADGKPLELGADSFKYATTGELLPAIAGLFAHLVEVATRQGLHRSYRQHDEDLVALRGRIDVTEQFRRTGIATPVACQFDEYTTDVAENRILKEALSLLVRIGGVPDRTRRFLAGLILPFAEVTDTALGAGALDRITYTRLNGHYERPLGLARLILESASLVDQTGGRAASSFTVNMNTVFEQFIEHRLDRALAGHLRVTGQHQTTLDHGRKVNIKPDLLFSRHGSQVYVADTKYKLSNDGLARQADYYQLLAYTTALGLPEGMLIYCHDDGDMPPTEIVVRESEKRLVAYHISLAGSRQDISDSVDALAAKIAGRCRQEARYRSVA